MILISLSNSSDQVLYHGANRAHTSCLLFIGEPAVDFDLAAVVDQINVDVHMAEAAMQGSPWASDGNHAVAGLGLNAFGDLDCVRFQELLHPCQSIIMVAYVS